MKHIFFILIIIFIQNFVCAQSALKKDSYNLSGGFTFAVSNTDHPEFDSNSKSVVFNPALTYHILDIFSLGGNISYDYAETKITDDSGERKSITRILNFGPTARYYFHNQNLAPFVESSFNYSTVLAKDTEGYSFSFGAGINYFFTKSIALEPRLTYVISSYANPDYNSNTFRIGIGLNYHINE